MDLTNFSLLYPDAETKQDYYAGKNKPDIDMYCLQELGMLEILDLKSSDLSEYFTTSPAVMKYRNEVFSDMMNCSALSETLNELMPVLTDVTELRRLEADSGNTDDYLSSITEIELYISCIEILYEGLSRAKVEIKSRAFKILEERIRELAESEYYKELNKKLNELTKRVREIKSVAIGVNLDSQLRPQYAGVLSINSEPFKSGDTLDKILRLNFKNDDYTCIANLVPFGKKQSDNQKTALSIAFNSAINDVYHSSLKSWKKIVQSYVLENTDFLLGLMPEIEFLVKGTEMLKRLEAKGCWLTEPTIAPMDERVFNADDLYNPAVALKLPDGEEIIPNDVSFNDNDATIYVLTGPNRGGKSVITCAMGLGIAMMQLGMFVPAKNARISPADAIFTHFPTGADDTIDKGRLGEECARLGEIFDSVTKHSLVLLDESFSSTGSYEGSYIASEVLSGISMVGCRCLFATHLHELAAEIDRINKESVANGGVKIDTLVAGIEEGKRSFKIFRAKPDGKSYARDIAERYGLTYENILRKIGK
jgi:dsDNA-specific endonuclease/ATPase MutS2